VSEYKYVEKPFLMQLQELGWSVIEHPEGVIPHDPEVSRRESFREVILKSVFKTYVSKINLTDDGKEWLTDKQLEDLYTELDAGKYKNMLEANKGFHNLLQNKTSVLRNELTGEEHPKVQFIDFENVDRNSFIAINQFRVDTIGTAKSFVIPDIVLFVNGIPVSVIECKYENSYTANPMEEGITQLLRYQNRRDAQNKEGVEKLFYFNQFVVSTTGEDAKVGSVTSDYEHFLSWKDIYPEKYRKYEPILGKERVQEKLIQGMLPPETLLDIIRHFIIFTEKDKKTTKIVCRYQQYRAVKKSIVRLLTGDNPSERSGVIWHTQGSGKSLTMVFLVRNIRTTKELHDYKILVLNDRTDLEDQLGDTMELTDEPIDKVNNIKELSEKISVDTSNLVMVMTQKFQESKDKKGDKLNKLLKEAGVDEEKLLPVYKKFGLINPSEKVLILIDEAHRTQSGELALNINTALPNATKIAFTGTPLVTERWADKRTVLVFGDMIDTYKIQDSVDDGTTVPIFFEGKTQHTKIGDKEQFDVEFEDMFAERTAEELEQIKKKYGALKDIFEAEKRIEKYAADMLEHYINTILDNGFKAQVVATSKLAAARYKTALEKAIQTRLKKENLREQKNEKLIKNLEFMKVAMVVSSDDTNEAEIITRYRKESKSNNAIDNFKKKFNYEEPLTGICFLVVCDMLLTGFDAPIEQVMYIDKKMKEHTLLQAIARVNRTASGKECGYIVDYIGIAAHLKEALSIYGSDETADVLGAMKDISTELPVLKDRVERVINLFKKQGIEDITDYVNYKIDDIKKEYAVLEQCVELLASEKLRAEFNVNYKKFLQSMDIVMPNPRANEFMPMAKAFAHIHTSTKHRYKDTSVNLMGVGGKIKNLINKHLISLGVDIKIAPVELLSPNFTDSLEKNKTIKAKASEMEHAIRKHCKVNMERDPGWFNHLSEKLQEIIKKYEEDVEEKYSQLSLLKQEIETGTRKDEDAFVDLIVDNLKIVKKDVDKSAIKKVVDEILEAVRSEIKLVDFWNKPHEQNILLGQIDDMLLFANIDGIIDIKEKLARDILELAKHREKELLYETT